MQIPRLGAEVFADVVDEGHNIMLGLFFKLSDLIDIKLGVFLDFLQRFFGNKAEFAHGLAGEDLDLKHNFHFMLFLTKCFPFWIMCNDRSWI